MLPKKILVTGAAGFIGSSLTDVLLESGFSVLGIDNFDKFYSRKIKEKNLEKAKKNPLFNLMEGDIRDHEFVNNCFSGFKPDVVVHLAAKAGVRPSLEDPESYFDVNVNGTLNILTTMKKNNVSNLVFASSSSVYGNNKKVPFSEADNVDFPISPYAASKKSGELLCHTYHHLYGFNIYCLRFFTVYGPRQRPDLAIHKFLKALKKNEPLCLFGNGTTSRDYTYINDIVKGVVAAIEKVKGYEIINLGGARAIKLNELVEILEKSTGLEANRKYLEIQDGDVMSTFADISKAGSLLKYSPSTEFENGIKRFVEWFDLVNG